MLANLVLVAAGFLGGVLLTGFAAVCVFGRLHAEAVRVAEGRSGLWLFTTPALPAALGVGYSDPDNADPRSSFSRSPDMRVDKRRLSATWLAALLGVGVAAATPASAQVSPSAAPAEWVQYAEGATAAIAGWLQAGDPVAMRLRDYLDGTRPTPDQPSPPLALKVWISPEGVIERMEFTPFADAGTNDDLRVLIVGRRLAAAPPKGMLQPMRLSIQLDPAEQASDPANATHAHHGQFQRQDRHGSGL